MTFAYILGNWDSRYQWLGKTWAEVRRTYSERLAKLASIGIKNTATWHVDDRFEGENYTMKDCGQVDRADFVIVLLDPTKEAYRHLGALFYMIYAAAQGKPSYVVCSKQNALFDVPFMRHDLFAHFESFEELVDFLSNEPTEAEVNNEVAAAVASITLAVTERKRHATVCRYEMQPKVLRLLNAVNKSLKARGYKTHVESDTPAYPNAGPTYLSIFAWLRSGFQKTEVQDASAWS